MGCGYGCVRRALGRRIGIVQIDAHADLRRAYQGFRHSHASVMQLLAEEEGMALGAIRCARALFRGSGVARQAGRDIHRCRRSCDRRGDGGHAAR